MSEASPLAFSVSRISALSGGWSTPFFPYSRGNSFHSYFVCSELVPGCGQRPLQGRCVTSLPQAERPSLASALLRKPFCRGDRIKVPQYGRRYLYNQCLLQEEHGNVREIWFFYLYVNTSATLPSHVKAVLLMAQKQEVVKGMLPGNFFQVD